MTRVTNADQVLLLLRERLSRLDRARGKRAAGTGAKRPATARPVERLRTLDGVSDEEFRRTLVRALLAEELGDGIVADPSFQRVADEVFRVISSTTDGRDLIDRASRQLADRA